MQARLFKWLALVSAVVLGSSFVSMMATFVGSQGADLRDLMVLQAILVPVALAVVVWCFSILVRHFGYRRVFSEFWDRLPGLASVLGTCCELIGSDRRTFFFADPAPHLDLTAVAGTRPGRHGVLQLPCADYLFCDLSSGRDERSNTGRQ